MLTMAPSLVCNDDYGPFAGLQCSVDKLLIAMLPASQLEGCNADYGPFAGLKC